MWCIISVTQTLPLFLFWAVISSFFSVSSDSDTSVKFQSAALSGQARWVMWALLGKRHRPLQPPSSSQEAPVELRQEESWAGLYVLAKASYCVWILFISHMEEREKKGAFSTGINFIQTNICKRGLEKSFCRVQKETQAHKWNLIRDAGYRKLTVLWGLVSLNFC